MTSTITLLRQYSAKAGDRINVLGIGNGVITAVNGPGTLTVDFRWYVRLAWRLRRWVRR